MSITLTLEPDISAASAASTEGTYVHNEAHAAEAMANIIAFFGNETPRTQAFVEACAAQVQELEDAFWGLLTAFNLDTATGDQLLLLGRLVGEPQLGRSDEDFRAGIRARLMVNRSNGKAEEFYAIARALVPSLGVQLVLTEFPPLSGTLEFVDGNSSTLTLGNYSLDNIARLLRLAKLGGSRLDVIFAHAEETPQTSLLFATDDAADVSGLGQDDDGDVGGILSEVV